jgi:FtsK/SpoIIIE family
LLVTTITTLGAACLAGYSYLQVKGGPTVSDAQKIQKIFTNAGWAGKGGETIRLHRRRKTKAGIEYVYQLPLGFDRSKIEDNIHILEDGLNVRSKIEFNLSDLRDLKFDKTIVQQIQKLINGNRVRKEVEIEFDGMLKVKIFTKPFPTEFDWNDSLITKGWKIPVGTNRQKVIFHDFDSSYFMIVAGAAGFGKSQFIKMAITTLVLQQSENVKFHLIDLKGGLAFSRFKNLEQVVHFGKDRKDALQILKDVQKHMNETHDYLEREGFEDVIEAGIKERHFVVIDEAADLTDEAQDIVQDIARRGRACGLRMIYATQYPTNETLRSQVRQNALSRVCFKLKTNVASRAVLDGGGAESLPEIPGRAIYQTVSNVVVQTPYMSNKQIKELTIPFIKEEENEQKTSNETTKDRKYSFKFEETELHD